MWNTCGIHRSGQNKYNVEDERTEASNAIAREENGQIVLFSWFKWQKDWCRKLDEADYFTLRPPPGGADEDRSSSGGMTRALRALWPDDEPW